MTKRKRLSWTKSKKRFPGHDVVCPRCDYLNRTPPMPKTTPMGTPIESEPLMGTCEKCGFVISYYWSTVDGDLHNISRMSDWVLLRFARDTFEMFLNSQLVGFPPMLRYWNVVGGFIEDEFLKRPHLELRKAHSMFEACINVIAKIAESMNVARQFMFPGQFPFPMKAPPMPPKPKGESGGFYS